MRSEPEQQIALECLKMAVMFGGETGDIILAAEQFYAFASGDDTKYRLEAVRAALG